jgi:glycerol kinase
MLFNIHSLRWDDEILGLFNLPAAMLPQVQLSSGVYGETADEVFEGSHIPIAGIAGDQQASLFGQACYHTGMAKNTYGTGAFVLVNTGAEPVASKSGMVTTVAWGLENQTAYALEGSIFIGGAIVQWLRDGLGIIGSSAESESLAASVPDNGGVYFVPAFVGLGAPHWDMYARGTIVGLTQGINKGHLARASLEAIAFQTRDVIDAIRADLPSHIPVLRVDGGGSRNNLLMQFQADILGLPIQRAQTAESTALGASLLAGLAVGLWKTTDEIEKRWQSEATFEPRMGSDERDLLYHNWKRAIEKSRGWAERE